MSLPRHLVIFTRFPMAGAGKKRLAAGIGAVHALRFQRARLAVLLARHSQDPRWRTWLAITPGGPWPRGVRCIGQGRGDLGQRMGRVFATLPPGAALIIGADIPGITSTMIDDAFRKLGNHDAVFGPATDGGYWLIGMRRRPRMLQPFARVRWSTPHALSDTRANLRGATIAEIDRLTDVDDADSFKRDDTWARLCRKPPRRGRP